MPHVLVGSDHQAGDILIWSTTAQYTNASSCVLTLPLMSITVGPSPVPEWLLTSWDSVENGFLEHDLVYKPGWSWIMRDPRLVTVYGSSRVSSASVLLSDLKDHIKALCSGGPCHLHRWWPCWIQELIERAREFLSAPISVSGLVGKLGIIRWRALEASLRAARHLRVLLARRRTERDGPGKLVTVRRHPTRGPDSCRPICLYPSVGILRA